LVKRGNPFFVEETIRTLAETKALAGERGQYRLAKPIAAIQIPPTVQAMLAARIDRLPPEEKDLLQVASVVGKDVPFVLLREIFEEPEEQLRSQLVRLHTAEFLRETALSPDLQYSFKHALTHEVTYGGLLQERRRALHARIVEAIERLHQGCLGEQVDRLARHAVLGDLGEKAVDYLREAGLKASGRSAIHDARLWFEQALKILRELPQNASTLEKGFDIRLELRTPLAQLDELDKMLERLHEAESIAHRLNDEGRQGRVWVSMATSHRQQGELDKALEFGTHALELAERRNDLELRLSAAVGLEELHYYRGDFSRSIELARSILAVLPSDWVLRRFDVSTSPVSIFARTTLILSLVALGRFEEAATSEVETTELAEQTQHAFTIGHAHMAATSLYQARGDWARANSRIERWLAGVRAADIKYWIPVAVAQSAFVLAQLGETAEATTRLREGQQLLEQLVARGNLSLVGSVCLYLGHASLLLGHVEDAQRLGNRAREVTAARPATVPQVLWLLADIASHLDRSDPEHGETCYRKAMAAAKTQGRRPVLAHCHLGLGKLFSRIGRRQEAEEHFTVARTMYREMEMAFYLTQVEQEIVA